VYISLFCSIIANSSTKKNIKTLILYLCIELIRIFPAFDDVLYVTIQRSSVNSFTFDEVHGRHDRLSSWRPAVDLLHSRLVMHRSTVSVVSGKIDQEVSVVPTLHTHTIHSNAQSVYTVGRQLTPLCFHCTHLKKPRLILPLIAKNDDGTDMLRTLCFCLPVCPGGGVKWLEISLRLDNGWLWDRDMAALCNKMQGDPDITCSLFILFANFLCCFFDAQRTTDIHSAS